MGNEDFEQIKSIEEEPISSNNGVQTDQRTAELEESILRLEQELAQAKKDAAKKTTKPRTARSNASRKNSRTKTTRKVVSQAPKSVAEEPSQTSTITSANNANKTQAKKKPPKENGAAVARFWIYLVVFVFQLILIIYFVKNY